ncbi:MAG: hypothetical protein R3230_03345, partial [Nitrosopumilaceae archaeon]|nr:hypothetical protein [Nitrosopumilaceae archaeon]
MKKKQKQRILLIGVVVALVGGIIGFNYYIDQVKIKGGIFSNQIEQIQEDLTNLQIDFETNVNIYEENDITKKEFLELSEKHFTKMEELIQRYDELNPPDPFAASVDLFKLSAESQLQRDKQIALWIETGDESYSIRADELHQESF